MTTLLGIIFAKALYVPMKDLKPLTVLEVSHVIKVEILYSSKGSFLPHIQPSPVVLTGHTAVFSGEKRNPAFCKAVKVLAQLLWIICILVMGYFGDYPVIDQVSHDTTHQLLKGCHLARHPHGTSRLCPSTFERCRNTTELQ